MVVIVLSLLFQVFAQQKVAPLGVIVVHEAPLLLAPNISSQVLQTFRMGDTVRVHPKHFLAAPDKLEFEAVEQELKSQTVKPKFIEAYDRLGNLGHIPKEFIKLIYKDEREFAENARPFKLDPTDYRLTEPLYENYPLVDPPKGRSTWGFGFGNSAKANYPYSRNIDFEDFSNRFSFFFHWQKRPDWDLEQRIHFGGQFYGDSVASNFLLSDLTLASERKLSLGAGPYLSYDFFRGKDWLLGLSLGLGLNYHFHVVEQNPVDQALERRIFDGFSFSGNTRFYATYKQAIFDFDLNIALEMQGHWTYTLSPTAQTTNSSLWNVENNNASPDEVIFPTNGIFSLFIGLQNWF